MVFFPFRLVICTSTPCHWWLCCKDPPGEDHYLGDTHWFGKFQLGKPRSCSVCAELGRQERVILLSFPRFTRNGGEQKVLTVADSCALLPDELRLV